jgi:hypothetical protein
MTKRRQRGQVVNRETVERLCAERNWRRVDLAKACRRSRGMIDKIWAGLRLDDKSIDQVAGALGVFKEELLYNESIHTAEPSANGSAIIPYRHATAPDGRASDACMELNFSYSTISLSIRDDAATPTTIKKLFSLLEEAMIEYSEYKSRVEEEMSIMLVIGTNPKNKHIFAYIAFLSSMYGDVMESIRTTGIVPDYAIIIEHGYGAPSRKIKAKMKTDYLFDHEGAEHLYHCENPSPGLD